MRISLNWLKDLVAFDLPADAIAEALTMAGFEVEDIEDRRTWADGVVVGRVLAREQHPNADRLSVCRVDVGREEPLTIVCGAKNVAAGQTVAVATVGTYLAKIDLKLKPTKLRGVPSQGMICSLSELGLAKESEGIHVFSEGESLAPGTDVRPLLGLDETILDLTSTANRADALSMVGIAREVAALTGGTVTLPGAETAANYTSDPRLTVVLPKPKACPTYVATAIAGVTIAPSPDWLQARLTAAGLRPINNVVDVTNLIALEWGQPLHAFDHDRLIAVAKSPTVKLSVRQARSGETLATLDGQSRDLSAPALVITANDQPVALAGVLGGANSEVQATTTNLVLEAALFEPAAVRRSARSVGVRTDASTRYERGTNQVEFDQAYQRAIDLILELAGGEVATQAIADHRPSPEHFSRRIDLRFDRLCQILGPLAPPPIETGPGSHGGQPIGQASPETARRPIATGKETSKDNSNAISNGSGDDTSDTAELQDFLPATEVEQILTALGCQVSITEPGDQEAIGRIWHVRVPAYRYRDLEREIDLIEEVARLYGYNRFASTLPPKTEFGFLPPDILIQRRLREALRGVGLTELMHYSLRKPEGDRQILLSNPLLAEYSALRTELISGLIEAYQYNLEQGNGPLWGFELGRVFWSDEDGLVEADVVAGILGGDPSRGKWLRGGKDAPLSWYEAKGILEAVFDRLGLAVDFQADRSDTRLHPGRAASLWIGGDRLGTFGQLHPQLSQERDLPDGIYVFAWDLEVIYKVLIDHAPTNALFSPYPTYPASQRDLALFATTTISVSDLRKTMQKAGKPLLSAIDLFDEYRGEGVPAGQRSLAFRLTYRSSDRTLTDEDVEPRHQDVRDSIVEKFGVTLRS